MIPEYPEQLYQELQGELDRIQNLQLPEDKSIEESFNICMSLEQKLVDWVSPFLFDNDQDEIHFFKVTRPKFSAYIHYFKARYKAVLFQPADSKQRTAFFEYELDKAEKFFSENSGFYQYYKSGQTSSDHTYFIRSCPDDAGPAHPCRSETGYDQLIGSFLGLEMYKDFVREQLNVFNKT